MNVLRVLTVLSCIALAWSLGACTHPPNTSSDMPDESTSGDLIVDGVTRTFGAETRNITGNVIVRNGGALILNGTTLNIIESFEEEFTILITGNSRLTATDATIQAVGHQTAMIAEPKDGASPTLTFTNTTFTFHAGLRPFGNTVVTATNSSIEEVQVHDQAVVTISGGEGLYPVLFFVDLDAELIGLIDGEGVTRTVQTPGGWSLTIEDACVDGYQIDVVGDSTVTLTDCAAITASMHTSGELGSVEVRIANVTTVGRASGEIVGLGPEIIYQDSAIDLFNVYLAGSDEVRLVGGVVNEANTEDSSTLTIENCTVEYNLLQAYDQSTLVIENCDIVAGSSTPPSLTAESDSHIVVRNSDVARLEAQALDSARIDFFNVTNLDTELLSVQDAGAILVDNRQVR